MSIILAFSLNAADIIVVDRVHHLHSFTESPPNEFRFQETDSIADDDDDQTIMEKAHVNIVPNSDELETATAIVNIPSTETISFNNKENKVPHESSRTSSTSNDPSLDGTVEQTIVMNERVMNICLFRSS
jgi:hypothetical protein